MMKKNRRKAAPVPGTTVGDGFWADHVKLEHYIRNKWLRDYGHLFYQNQQISMPSRSDPQGNLILGNAGVKIGVEEGRGRLSGPPRGLVPQGRSYSREQQGKNVLSAPKGCYNYGGNAAEERASEYRQAARQSFGEGKAPKMCYDYPAPGNTQKHHVVKGHLAPSSAFFGDHSVQFSSRNEICAKKPTSANDFWLQIRSVPQSDRAVHTKYPYDLDKSKSRSPSHDSFGFKPAVVPFTPNRRVDLDELAMDLEGCTWAELQRRIESVHPLEICPKCENRLGCTCVPRRREKIPEDDPGNGPEDVLPPWPPQVWCGPSYNGSRVGTTGDILRLRHRLSRDPEWKTPMNRMYDEMKAVNYYGDKSHAGEHWYSCGPCRSANEAARGTWLDEQLRKGNPFTTGDTQFKSCGYMKKS